MVKQNELNVNLVNLGEEYLRLNDSTATLEIESVKSFIEGPLAGLNFISLNCIKMFMKL